MKHYMTLDQYLQLYQNSRVGYDVDLLSRNIVYRYLMSNGCSDILFTSGNNSTDIIATYNNTKFSVEVKDRSFKYNSTTFNDHCCEAIKLSSLIRRKKAGEFDKLYLISMFRDSCITITSDIDKPENILRQGKACFPKTTTLGDNELIEKDVVFYKQNLKVYFILWWEDGSNNIHANFAHTPFDVDKLNQEANQPVYSDVCTLM